MNHDVNMPSENENIMDYDDKDADYFQGARYDFIAELPENENAKILEVGCSAGKTGALALKEKKCGYYVGIDINEKAALEAKQRLNEVIVGDIEKMVLSWDASTFDVLILSEVLEHMVDPWAVLVKLHPVMKNGAVVFASSPNISHYKIIKMLIRGEWKLEDSGLMDRTHLRWFTPKTFAEMFEDTGYVVKSVEPVYPFRLRSKLRIALLFGKGKHLFMKQIKIKAICKK